MAQEITSKMGLDLRKGNAFYTQPIITSQIDQAGTMQYANTLNVGFATDEILPLPTWTATQGWALFRNLDATNFLEVGLNIAATFYPVFKLLPGEPASMRLVPSIAYYVLADTAAVDLFYAILEV